MQIDGEMTFWIEKYPEVPTFSHSFGVEDFSIIHQFNEPASGTCDRAFFIVAFEGDRTDADSDLIHFSFIPYVERRSN